MLLFINGSWVSENEAVIPFQDGGFLYGDSLFESIRVAAGRSFRIHKNLERLRQGLNVIRLELPWSSKELIEICNTFIAKNNLQDGLLRLIVTRGTITGSPWNFSGAPNVYLTGRSLPPLPELPVKLEFVQEKDYPIARFFPAIKSGNYLGNMLAKRDAEQNGSFEPIFVNRDGLITEGALRNIFFVRDGILLTPGLALGVLPGIMRDTVLEIASSEGIRIQEEAISSSALSTFSEAFISSTGIGILPAVWDGFRSTHKLTYHLRDLLEARLKTGK